MNANYQYFMMNGYNYAAGAGKGSGGDIIGGGGGGGGQDIIVDEMDEEKAPPTPYTKPSFSKPIYSKPMVSDIVDDISPIESKPISSIGDAAIITKDPTTINIYNPEGGTSTTSTESEVTVDGGTGQVSTPASKGGSKGGGFGGGGGGGSKGKGKGSAAPKAAKKAILPLAAIGVGIAILIFKPFKFLK